MFMLTDEEKELVKYLLQLRKRQVIVEGRKDKEVLVKLGFKKVITLTGKSLYECASLCKENVVILTDFDRKGEEIAKKLELFLGKSDGNTRNTLRRLFKANKLNTVEGLKKLVRKVVEYGKIGPDSR